MPLNSKIIGPPEGDDASVLNYHSIYPAALNVVAHPFAEPSPTVWPVVDVNGSEQMAVNGDPAGVASEQMYDGTNPGPWPVSIISGVWALFATSPTGGNAIDGTGTTGAARIRFDNGSSFSLANFSNLAMEVYVVSWPGNRDLMTHGVDGAGAQVGLTVDIDDYINTGLSGTWQTAIIPLPDMGSPPSVDGFDIFTSGNNLDFWIRNVRLLGTDPTAGPRQFTAKALPGTRFRINQIKATFSANIPPDQLDPTEMFGLPELANGILYQFKFGTEVFNTSLFRNFHDIVKLGSQTGEVWGGTTNNRLTYSTTYVTNPDYLVLDSSRDDEFRIFVLDDLSSFVSFTTNLSIGIEFLDPKKRQSGHHITDLLRGL